MANEPWFNIVPFDADFEAALQKTRAAVFASGNYTLTGTKKPRSIEEAVKRGGNEGTNSILDIARVAAKPADRAAAPLAVKKLVKLFGTEHPTEKNWWANYLALWDELEPGRAVVVVLYADDRPDKLAFAGLAME